MQPQKPSIKETHEDLKNRDSAFAPFAKPKFSGFRGVSANLFIFLVFILMSLPLFTTFNEILTKVAEKTGAYTLLAQHIVPFQTRAVSLLLAPLGIKATPTLKTLEVANTNGRETSIFFSWNCLGWQSAILLLLTLVTGLSGNNTLISKFETVLLGLSGTFLINLIRISTVVVIAYFFGQLPATLVHDYAGTLFTILWFFFFWWISYTFILEQ